MKKLASSLFLSFLLLLSLTSICSSQCLVADDLGMAKNSYVFDMLHDAQSNTIIAGKFTDSTRIGNQLLAAPNENFYVAKIDSAQNMIWSKIFTHNTYTMNIRLAFDYLGQIVVTGCFYDSVTFDSYSYVSFQGWDIFMAKLNPSTGSCIWLKRAGGLGGDIIQNMKLDGQGNLYITGSFHGYCNFGGITLTCTGTLSGFVAKYNSAGAVLWAKQIIEQSGMLNNDLALDADKNVIATGFFGSTANFGNGIILSSTGANRDAFVCKYDSLGNILWARQTTWYNTSSDNFYAVRCDASNNIYLLHKAPDALVKYNAQGDTVKTILLNSSSVAGINAFLNLKDDKVFVSGNFSSSVGIGSQVVNSIYNSSQFFIGQLDTSLTTATLTAYETHNTLNMLEVSTSIDTGNTLAVNGLFYSPAGITSNSVFNLPCSSSYKLFHAKACVSGLGLSSNKSMLEKINASPNPFSESCILTFSNPKNEVSKITILNSLGMELKNYFSNSSVFMLPKSDLKAGIYFVRISNSVYLNDVIKICLQ